MATQFATVTPADSLSAGFASTERIAELTEQMVSKMQLSSKAIAKINNQTRLLSFNAQIEAARTGGPAGAAFGVVASAMRDLSDKTSTISNTLEQETALANSTLQQIIESLATNVRGTRLSDLALTNIDLIDRNLYERSCDVRWWATDSSGVEALEVRTNEAYRYCSRRFGQILDSYTVYYDLVLCDMDGIIVANGRPESYKSSGIDCSETKWFQSALETNSGAEFGFESVHKSALVNDERVLVYSCCVRKGGEVNGAPLGVLGIVFNWDALAQTIVNSTPLSAVEKLKTRVCIVDPSGLMLADTSNQSLKETTRLSNWDEIKRLGKGYKLTNFREREYCIGFASSPGYETYMTGWYSLLIQD